MYVCVRVVGTHLQSGLLSSDCNCSPPSVLFLLVSLPEPDCLSDADGALLLLAMAADFALGYDGSYAVGEPGASVLLYAFIPSCLGVIFTFHSGDLISCTMPQARASKKASHCSSEKGNAVRW